MSFTPKLIVGTWIAALLLFAIAGSAQQSTAPAIAPAVMGNDAPATYQPVDDSWLKRNAPIVGGAGGGALIGGLAGGGRGALIGGAAGGGGGYAVKKIRDHRRKHRRNEQNKK